MLQNSCMHWEKAYPLTRFCFKLEFSTTDPVASEFWAGSYLYLGLDSYRQVSQRLFFESAVANSQVWGSQLQGHQWHYWGIDFPLGISQGFSCFYFLLLLLYGIGTSITVALFPSMFYLQGVCSWFFCSRLIQGHLCTACPLSLLCWRLFPAIPKSVPLHCPSVSPAQLKPLIGLIDTSHIFHLLLLCTMQGLVFPKWLPLVLPKMWFLLPETIT